MVHKCGFTNPRRSLKNEAIRFTNAASKNTPIKATTTQKTFNARRANREASRYFCLKPKKLIVSQRQWIQTHVLKKWGFTIHNCCFERHTYKKQQQHNIPSMQEVQQRGMKMFLLEKKWIVSQRKRIRLSSCQEQLIQLATFYFAKLYRLINFKNFKQLK